MPAHPSFTELPAPNAIQAGSFHGQVVRPGLLDILDTCHRLGLSGMLEITAGAQKATVHLDGGRIRFAQLGDQIGTTALTRAILLEKADFHLAPATQRPARNVNQDSSFVLQSIAKVLSDAGVALSPAFLAARAAEQKRGGSRSDAPAVSAPQPTKAPAAFQPPAVGTNLGQCKLVTEFARGGSGIIYLAWHTAFKLDVVVKVLRPPGQDNPHDAMLTANEAHILARLSHPAIMRIFAYEPGGEGSFPYLVMEWVDGRSLASLVKERGRLTAGEALPLLSEAAEGLAYAHAALGIIHLDLKPDNLLVDKRGQVRVIDFGLAGVPGAGQGSLHSHLVKAGKVIGTPAYIAPELVEGGVVKADHRSDIYSFGATAYHLLVGRPPFTDPDPIQVMVRRLHEFPEPPVRAVPEIPAALSDLVLRMMAVAPGERPQSWNEVLDGFAEIAARLGDHDTRAIRRRTSFWQRFTADDAESAP